MCSAPYVGEDNINKTQANKNRNNNNHNWTEYFMSIFNLYLQFSLIITTIWLN